METPSRILLIDDHRLLMEGERSLLAPYAHLRIVGQAASGEEGIASAAALRPDICLLDLSMPGIGGVEACRGVLETLPDCKVVIYSRHDDGRFLLELFQAGIWGYVCKKDSPGRLLQAVEAVRRGEVFMGLPDPAGERTAMLRKCRSVKRDDSISMLSPREREILRLLADGLLMKQDSASGWRSKCLCLWQVRAARLG